MASDDSGVLLLGTIMALIGVGCFLIFGLIYVLFTKGWWRTLIGWMSVTLAIAVSSAGVPVVLAGFLGQDYPGRLAIRTGLFSLLAFAGALYLFTYLFTRIRRPRRPSASPSAPTPTAD